MLRKLLQSFLLALQNIRSNFFHTFLSVLGIVIGVGALVSILSLIDGMEEYAKKEISTTTSLNMISVSSETFKRVDGISLRKDSVSFLQYHDFLDLRAELSRAAKSYLFQRTAKEVSLENDTSSTAAHVTGVIGFDPDTVLYGNTLLQDHIDNRALVCVLTEKLAQTLAGKSQVSTLIGKNLMFGNRKLTIIGIARLKFAMGPELFFPFTLISPFELRGNLPQCVIEAENVVDVPHLKEDILKFLNSRFTEKHDFKVTTNEQRVAQATKAFGIFRIIMGLIVGISVVVGGVGVMNVLLISVTERTAEIGIRKAVGANRRDIILLFLSESVTVSAFGSLVGLIFGTLFTMAAIPIIKALTEAPFQAAYTWNTLLVISVVAVLVGIIFGTYPALRASWLNPVDAIRHE